MKTFQGALVAKNSRLAELLEARDTKTAKRLVEYCRKAEECFYDWKKIQELRKEYSDIL